MTHLAPGDVVQGYRVVRVLSRGGVGTTFEATREADGERVALKRLAVSQVNDWKRIELFEREASVLAGLKNERIPRYLEHFSLESAEGRVLYIAEQFLDGESLADLGRAGRLPMSEADVRRIGTELLAVLDYLGRESPPVIHRDIKPDNVLLRPDGSVALVDFGAARSGLGTAEGGSTTVGTYGYMASEQLHGVATPATDIYGLACTLLFLLTGTSPSELPRRKLKIDFEPATRGRITPPFAAWLHKALEPVAEDRFTSAHSALAALRGLPGGGGPAVDFGPPGARRSRVLLRSLQVGLVVALTMAGLTFWKAANGGRLTLPVLFSAPKPGPLAARWAPIHTAPPLTLVRWWGAHMSAVFSVAVSPSGKEVVSSSNDGTVKIWDLKTGEAVRALPGHTGRVGGVAWSPDGAWIASAGDKTVLVHDAATGRVRLTIDAGCPQVSSVDIASDGKRIAAGCIDGTARVWASDTGKLETTVTHSGRVLTTRLSPDGHWLATAGDAKVHIWAADTGASRAVLAGHRGDVGGVAWAPDGRVLASASDDHTLRLWIANDAHELAQMDDAKDELWKVAFDPRGKYVASVGKEGMLRVYDVMSTKLVATRQIEARGVPSVAWAPDGETLVTGDGVGRVEVLTVAPKSKVDEVPAVPANLPLVPESKAPSEATYNRAMAIAFAHNRRRDALDAASAIFAEALKADPTDALAVVGQARVALYRGYISGSDYTKASLAAADALVAKAIALSPDLADAHVQRGWQDTFRKDYVRAKDEALTADKARSTSRSQLLLAQVAYDTKDLDGAETHATRALSLGTRRDAVQAYQLLESLYRWRGDEPAAERTYERMIELDPTNPWTKGNYADFLVEHRQYDRAIAMARAALELSNYGAARRTVAQAYAEKGADELWTSGATGVAKSAFDDAVVADRGYGHAHYGLGAYFRKLAFDHHDVSLLARSSQEFDLAASLDKDPSLAKRARADNDTLKGEIPRGGT